MKVIVNKVQRKVVIRYPGPQGPAASVSSVDWAAITGKPSEFAPIAHQHSWASITGKPSVFAPDQHIHNVSDITGAAPLVSPSFTTPRLGVASATSLSATGVISGGALDSLDYVGCYRVNFTGSTVLGVVGYGHLGLSNGSSAQSFSIYKVAGTDYERGVFDWQTTANTLTIGTQKGGAGSARGIDFVVGGVNPFSISTSGHLLAGTDNAYDIGASGATRPRNLYLANDLTCINNRCNYLSLVNSVYFQGQATGVVTFYNWLGTSFDRVQFGGTTSSFPSIKRRTTSLEARLADDSAITTLVGAMVLKAGAVSDADFTNPVNGCHGFDTTNFKHYVRVGGAWKSSAAYT